MTDLYDQDFFGWAQLQARLLRDGRVSEADLDHIAEEIEDMGRNRQQELRNRLAVLLLHLLEWQYQSGRRTRSWSSTIREQRARIADHLQANPSLRPLLAESIETGYRYALLRVDRETGMSPEEFPPHCPYSNGEILDGSFFPDAAP